MYYLILPIINIPALRPPPTQNYPVAPFLVERVDKLDNHTMDKFVYKHLDLGNVTQPKSQGISIYSNIRSTNY